MNTETTPIIHLEEVDSTNTYMRNLLRSQKVKEGTTISADFQSAGRGQRGNSWESRRGENLSFSTILFPRFLEPSGQFIISQCVALAVKDVLTEYTPDIKIKWPNDIFWRKQKICGILIENDLEENRIVRSIVGIGININQESFDCVAPYSPASLAQILEKKQDRMQILTKVVNKIMEYFDKIKKGETETIAQKYKQDLFSTGQFHDASGDFEATIKDILPSGHLVLSDADNKLRYYAFKDVSFVID